MTAAAGRLGAIAPAAPAAPVREAAGRLLLPPAAARAIGFMALAGWSALHWLALLRPAEPDRGARLLAVALAALLALLAIGRLGGRRRQLLAAVAVLPLLAAALLVGGAHAALLRPSGWSELASGVDRGLGDLPGLRMPYGGIDPWIRLVIAGGGSVLVLIAALLAFWPRRARRGHPYAALLTLTIVFAVPIVALHFRLELVRGAVFALLVLAFLRLETLHRADAGPALALALAAVLLALIAAPALNGSQPWWNYEAWAFRASASRSTSYDWNHGYGPLQWPRDGRELLRVKASAGAYWKTENLDAFDGTRWYEGVDPIGDDESIPADPARARRFTQTIRVSIRNLRSAQFVGSGTTTDVRLHGVEPFDTGDGSFVPSRALERGDTYTATVYDPRPSAAQRARAGSEYPSDLVAYRSLAVPIEGVRGASRISMTFPAYGDAATPLIGGPPSRSGAAAEQVLTASPLGRVYRLALRLRAGTRTPEAFVQRVLAHLASGYAYDELPPRAAATLPGFLFDARRGYCQHFSGAMALLLRMGGVPARVSSGFTTGSIDAKTGEYVVRDYDAHSWVEVFYPGWGWVTFDPTPAVAPARSASTAAARARHAATPANPSGDAPALRSRALAASGGGPWWRLPLLLVGALALLAGALAVGLRRTRSPAPLQELERALRRSRRTPAPGTTLQALEARFAATPAAAAYVRALREARYRDVAAAPTRAQRAALRSELGRGAGLPGRLRAWWALPPR